MSIENPSIWAFCLARDCEQTIESSISHIRKAVQPWGIEGFVIVESDSDDLTISTLERLSAQDSSLNFRSLGRLSNQIPNRVDRIAHCREFGRSLLIGLASPDLVIVFDADGPANGLTTGSIRDAVRLYGKDFDGLFANGTPRYYDIFALRADGWSAGDYVQEESQHREAGMNRFKAKYEALVKKQVRLKRSRGPISVSSAFGGVSVYTGQAFTSAGYSASNLGICEHVAFNYGLITAGFKLAIVPSLTVRSPMEHIWFSSFLLRPIWWIFGLLPVMPRRGTRDMIGKA